MGPKRFIMDAMLGSLARKLRAFGFDALFYREGGDERLIKAARESGRVVVTADRTLSATLARKGLGVLLVEGKTDSFRIGVLLARAAEKGMRLEPGDPRCSVCNGRLRGVRRAEVTARLPDYIVGRHRLFEECAACHKLYWRGSHWKKLRSQRRRFLQFVPGV
ncbi:MAG: hypothetical protein JRN24_02865 [Nitrososphaerota archaeon]|nr:hypothetical protein [Nitrososphaerota archaeon]